MSSGEERGPFIDYLRPIVADADTGHGGALFSSFTSAILADRIRSNGCDEVDEDDGRIWSCRYTH